MFAAGAVQALVSILLWTIDLGGRYAALWAAPSWPLPSSWLHALLMQYGIFPYFIFGFILTAGPRWQGASDLIGRDFVQPFIVLSAGWAIFYAGLLWPRLLPFALFTVLIGWLGVLRLLWRIERVKWADRRHIRAIAVAILCGFFGLACATLMIVDPNGEWARGMILFGIWGFLLPVFFSVAHRMIPFFSSAQIPNYRLYSPYWALWGVLAASMAHGVLESLALTQTTWVVDIPAAVIVFALSWRWRLRQSLVSSLLAVLHISFVWLGIAFALFAVRSLSELVGFYALGLAPLHALTIGYFASTAVGMVSRVTRGHSGLVLMGDRPMIVAFCCMQLAAVARVGSEFVALPGPWNLAFVASLMWLTAFGVWAVRYMPAYWRPRADGRPG